MKKTKYAILVLMLINMVFSPGCWNYREINDISVAAGMAVDIEAETGKLLVTVELVKPTAGRKQSMIEAEVIEYTGDTIFEAIRNIISHSGKKLYWSHAKVIIISQQVAKRGIIDILDWVNRDAEIRDEVRLYVSREKTAREIFQAKPVMESIVSYELFSIERNYEQVGKFITMSSWEFISSVSAEGISASAPVVGISYSEKNPVVEVCGTAVFKQDKLEGYLDGELTRGLLWMKDDLKSIKVVATKEKDMRVGLEVLKSSAKLKPMLDKSNELYLKIDIKTDLVVGEIAGTENVLEKEKLEKLKEIAQLAIAKDVEATLKELQTVYNADIIGFGKEVQINMPELWKEIKPSWNNIFKRMPVEINVEATIKGSALTSKPIKMGD